MGKNTHGDHETPVEEHDRGGSDGTAVIYPQIADGGNARVLREWLADHDSYIVAADQPLTEAAFDLCIVDREALQRYEDELTTIKSEAEPLLLPVLLLSPDGVGADRTAVPTNVVDEVLQLPIQKAALEWRIQTLLRLREKTFDLHEEAQKLRRFREAAEASAHAIYIMDTDGTIEYVNPAFEDITGYTESEILGEKPNILKSDEHEESLYDRLWGTLLDGQQWENEMVDKRKDGEEIVLEQTIAPVMTEEGEIEKFVAVAQDVTERKTYERRLEEQRDDLELLNQVVRHDIRNDLQLVTAYGELLADHVEDAGREHLDKILEGAENAIALTGSARDLADVMLQSSIENTSIDLVSTVRKQLEETRSANENAEIRVDGSLPHTEIVANPMLSSVIRNLLNNAINHNDKAVPEVTISVEEDNDYVTLRVADNGPSVPDGQKEEIFGKGEMGLESAGTGIGLYLVKSLVDSYGGAVWVEDNDPEGAVFAVKLQKAT